MLTKRNAKDVTRSQLKKKNIGLDYRYKENNLYTVECRELVISGEVKTREKKNSRCKDFCLRISKFLQYERSCHSL